MIESTYGIVFIIIIFMGFLPLIAGGLMLLIGWRRTDALAMVVMSFSASYWLTLIATAALWPLFMVAALLAIAYQLVYRWRWRRRLRRQADGRE
jgi:hypothetical protein